MPNNSAISNSKKRPLVSVSTSVPKYAGPAWVLALQTKKNTSRLNSTFRLMAMRVSSASRQRAHGEVNFHMPQFWSSHGCFKKYLNRFGHVSSPFCIACGDAEETPEHVVLECPRFEHERNGMRTIVGEDVNMTNIVERMCASKEKWDAVNRTVVQIMSALQRSWREEQRPAT
ncbi:uncharacterized protein LOC131687067 [Topomyia yanbarensis]|uniref:uncharacterized protein LOC131687067 n=1 Tax=Topomyia yanbarensis TaxID=2498891 RepID=UPI00273BBB34|nr:uncharacterized protein LOC131687067 [Topomyia yanbarensis]